jgi:hypothetical protein
LAPASAPRPVIRRRPLKDLRPRRLTSLFGVVAVRAPRFGPCRCGVASRQSIMPVAEIMPDRLDGQPPSGPERAHSATQKRTKTFLPSRRAEPQIGSYSAHRTDRSVLERLM